MQFSDGWQKKEGCPGIVAAMLNGNQLRGKLDWCAGVDSERPETRDVTVREFLRFLRWLVDQWIASGKHDGGESAWERSVHWTSKDQPTPLAEILVKWTETTNPPRLLIGPDSRFEIGVTPLFLLNRKSVKNVDPASLGYASAVYWFASLVDSPTRERFCRCDGCSTYFVRERMPRKDIPVKRGTYCANCKRKGTDKARRTIVSRKNRTKRMIEWAADAAAQWKSVRRHGELAIWIARRVNKRLPAGWKQIEQGKTNWFTRHRKEIEAEFERRNHAKG